jgi:hypothetical protein
VVVIDLLVVDVDGTPFVVELWHQAGASKELVDRAAQDRDLITFVTGGWASRWSEHLTLGHPDVQILRACSR